MMPALASSSLYLPMAVSSSVLGFAPASESRLALTMIMNRMVVSLGNDVWCRYMVEWRGAISTSLYRLRSRLAIAELGGECEFAGGTCGDCARLGSGKDVSIRVEH